MDGFILLFAALRMSTPTPTTDSGNLAGGAMATASASVDSPYHYVSPEVIKLNIGGHPYLCKLSTLRSRATDSKLARFVQSSHEARLCLCDAYFVVSHSHALGTPAVGILKFCDFEIRILQQP